MDRQRQQEIRQRLLTLEMEGADIGRAARRVGWTPEEGLPRGSFRFHEVQVTLV